MLKFVVSDKRSKNNTDDENDLFFSVRGAENVHIYFWIAKDICWLFNSKIGLFFGSCSLMWLGVLLYYSILHGNNEESYMVVARFWWLLGNFIWMTSNILYNDDRYSYQARISLMIGIIMVIIYFIWFIKLEYYKTNEKLRQIYDNVGLIPKFQIFDTWRRYELLHILFWLIKDYSWCSGDQVFWFVGAIPTLIISIDFIVISHKNNKIIVDLSHYIAESIWLCSNLTWAFSELFTLDSDKVIPLNSKKMNGRAIATYIILFSWLPIIILYLICFIKWTIKPKSTSETPVFNPLL